MQILIFKNLFNKRKIAQLIHFLSTKIDPCSSHSALVIASPSKVCIEAKMLPPNHAA